MQCVKIFSYRLIGYSKGTTCSYTIHSSTGIFILIEGIRLHHFKLATVTRHHVLRKKSIAPIGEIKTFHNCTELKKH